MTAEQATSVVGKKPVVDEDDSFVDVMTWVVEDMSLALVFWNSDPKLLPDLKFLQSREFIHVGH
jgi:hypothetical protein